MRLLSGLSLSLCAAGLMLIGVGTASGEDKANPPQRDRAEVAKLAATADQIIERFMKEKQVPGLVLAVIRDGQVIVEKGYGARTPGDTTPPDSNTLFYIGSLSKAITAVGIELLAERGKLKLDDPAGQYVKDLPKPWQEIPLKLFLAHQSGIPEMAGKKERNFDAELRAADNLPMAFAAGTKQQYNNFNFAVAGKVIESASGKSYLDFMQQEVFKPLGMTRTGFRQTDPNSALGVITLKNGQLEVVTQVAPKKGDYAIPSGFIQTTLGDLLRFYHGIEEHKLLPPARTEEMLSPVTAGMTGTPGWFASTRKGLKIVGKNGAATGYSCEFEFAPGRGAAVIFIMNLQAKELGTAALAHQLLRDVCGLPLPEKRPPSGDN